MAEYDIEINEKTCICCELCSIDAPKTFKMGKNGVAALRSEPGNSASHVLLTARFCPTASIILRDRDTGELVWPEESYPGQRC
jgi:ferredoxin